MTKSPVKLYDKEHCKTLQDKDLVKTICMTELPLNDEALKHNCFTVLENIQGIISNLLRLSYNMGMTFQFLVLLKYLLILYTD